MDADLLLFERHQVSTGSFAELRIWRVPSAVRGSDHMYKYSLAFVIAGKCVLRYDNEAGKGDHKHIGPKQIPYTFSSATQLLADFWSDVDQWRQL